VDGVGGENNAFTGKDMTGYYIKLQSGKLEIAFDLLSDMLANSLYKEEEIERERGTIIEEINMYEDTPMFDIDEVFYNLLYGQHPLGWSVAGTKETVSNLKREDFVNYSKRFYQGSDMVLTIAGNVKDEEVKKLSEKYFSSFEKGKKEEIVKFEEKQTVPQVKIKYKNTDQAHLYLGYPSFSFLDEDKTALSLLGAILGGGMSSRLFIQVRERRGLAYYIKSTSDLHQDSGYFAARAGVNIGKIDEAVKVIYEEFNKVLDGDISQEEVIKAKEFVKGRISLSLEDTQEVAQWFGEKILMLDKVETPKDIFQKIDKITLEEINAVAKRVIRREKINLAIIGPIKDENRFLNYFK